MNIEQKKMEFQLAADVCKQLLTLASGVTTVTFAFAKDFIKSQSRKLRWIMIFGWLFLIASMCFGSMNLGAMTMVLAGPAPKTQEEMTVITMMATLPSTTLLLATTPMIKAKANGQELFEGSTYQPDIQRTAQGQQAAFGLGVLCLAVFAAGSLGGGRADEADSSPMATHVVEISFGPSEIDIVSPPGDGI